MKKLMIGFGMFVLVVAVLRRIGPRLAEQAMQKCQEMFERVMPERGDLPSEPSVAPARR